MQANSQEHGDKISWPACSPGRFRERLLAQRPAGKPSGSEPVDGAPRLPGSGASPRSNLARLCPCRRASWLYLQSSRRNPPPGCSTDLGGTRRAGLTTWPFVSHLSQKSRCYFLNHKEKKCLGFFGSALTPAGSWDPNPGWKRCPHALQWERETTWRVLGFLSKTRHQNGAIKTASRHTGAARSQHPSRHSLHCSRTAAQHWEGSGVGPWTGARFIGVLMKFSRQEYWRG